MPDLNEHIAAAVKHSRAFYQQAEPGYDLINAMVPAENPAIPPLLEFDLDHELPDWLDYKLAQDRPLWRVKEGLDDDAIPASYHRPPGQCDFNNLGYAKDFVTRKWHSFFAPVSRTDRLAVMDATSAT